MKKVHLTIVAGLLCASTLLLAQNGKVTLTSHSFKEVTIKDKNGHTKTSYIDTKKVLPGDIVMYQNSIHNGTEKAVKNMVVNNPIPKEMAYVQGSAKCQSPCTVLYSVDNGKVFDVAEKLKIKTKNGTRTARADEYTNIRWILKTPLAPGKETTVSYKAKLR